MKITITITCPLPLKPNSGRSFIPNLYENRGLADIIKPLLEIKDRADELRFENGLRFSAHLENVETDPPILFDNEGNDILLEDVVRSCLEEESKATP